MSEYPSKSFKYVNKRDRVPQQKKYIVITNWTFPELERALTALDLLTADWVHTHFIKPEKCIRIRIYYRYDPLWRWCTELFGPAVIELSLLEQVLGLTCRSLSDNIKERGNSSIRVWFWNGWRKCVRSIEHDPD